MEQDTGTRSLERGLRILNCFRPGTGALQHRDLLETTQLPRATLSRLIGTLCEQGYLVRNHDGPGYRLGVPVLSLARALQVDADGLSSLVSPVMHRVASELRVVAGFGSIHQSEVVYLAVCNQDETRPSQRSAPGMRVPIMSTGIGLACVAGYPPTERDRVTAPLRALPSWTRGSSGLIEKAAREIRRLGYCHITYRDGNHASVAAPVTLLGGTVWAFNVSYPAAALASSEPPREMIEALHNMLRTIPADMKT